MTSAISADHYAFGMCVREFRARRGASQEALGLRSGLHRNYVGAIERGEINPTLKTLLVVVRGLETRLSELALLYEERREEYTARYWRMRGWKEEETS
ncbi:helix-turn-helix transcriptional regulator [Conexibacter sp. CPCC 206217]|nr:helix-turn-helix transcriptional regulator [Conexibacter sp. CPCC 206217]MDO8208956.1 helix-turn-helix transcriptional regulator [Conexibacter sp. CPCC 206217]